MKTAIQNFPPNHGNGGTALLRGALPWLVALALWAAPGAVISVHGSASPPDTLTYQGFLVDGNGNPLAPTTPQNYPVIFRIYNVTSGGAALWAEQQIVTVDKGNFSVLLGEGTQVAPDPRPLLSSVFAGTTASDRYIGISVTIGGTTTEILPRLRLAPSPYAFLATSASSLVQPNGSPFVSFDGGQANIAGNLGIGAPAAGRRLQIGDANTANSEGMIRLASRSGTGGSTRTWDIGVPETDQDTTGVGYSFVIDDIQRAGTEFIVRWDTGNVGIGTPTPNALLSLGSSLANTKLALWDGGAASMMGLGIQGAQFRLHLNASGDRFSFLNGPAGTEVMTIQGSGNVGFGTASPARRLHVNGTETVVGRFDSSHTAGTWLSLGNSSVGGRYWHVISTGSGNGEGAGKLLLGSGTVDSTTAIKMTLQDNGNVGIGTTSPNGRLSLGGGDATEKLVLWDGGSAGNTMGLGVGAGQFRLYLNPGSSRFTFLDGPTGNEMLNIWDSGAFNFGGGLAAQLNVNHGGFSDSTVTIQKRAGDNWALVLPDGNALKPGGGSWAAFSDKRLKNVLGEFKYGLNEIKKLETVRYRYVEDKARGLDSKTEYSGFVAQDVQPVIPEAVSEMSDGYLVLNMDLIYLASVNAIKQLDANLKSLQTEKAALQQQLADLESKDRAREERLVALESLVKKLAEARPAGQRADGVGSGEQNPSAAVR